MKNVILILLSVLMLTFGLLTIISSSDDYAAEKLFYQAVSTSSKIAINPDVAPPKMLAGVEDNLQKILRRYPESKVAKAAHFALVEFYLNVHKYEQAFLSLDSILNVYPQDVGSLSKAHFFKAVAYEKQDRWDEAIKEYKILLDKYADVPFTIKIPLHIAEHYQEKKNYARAQQAYREAASFYKKTEQENRGQGRGYAAANFLLRAYIELQEYEQAAVTIEDTVDNYPKLLPLVQQVVNIETIYVQKLNNPTRAIKLYDKMKTKTDDPQLLKLLGERIQALEGRQK